MQSQSRQRRSTFAIASLVTGVTGLFPLSIAFGIIALLQIKRTGQRGRSLAITGLVLGVVGVLAAAVAIQLFLLHRDAAANHPPLQPGDCVDDIKEDGALAQLQVVSCTVPHEGEVFAKFDIAGTEFPTKEKFGSEARVQCQRLIYQYTTRADDKVGLYYLHPSQESWEKGDREVICIAIDVNGVKRTGSIKAGSAADSGPTPSPTP